MRKLRFNVQLCSFFMTSNNISFLFAKIVSPMMLNRCDIKKSNLFTITTVGVKCLRFADSAIPNKPNSPIFHFNIICYDQIYLDTLFHPQLFTSGPKKGSCNQEKTHPAPAVRQLENF